MAPDDKWGKVLQHVADAWGLNAWFQVLRRIWELPARLRPRVPHWPQAEDTGGCSTMPPNVCPFPSLKSKDVLKVFICVDLVFLLQGLCAVEKIKIMIRIYTRLSWQLCLFYWATGYNLNTQYQEIFKKGSYIWCHITYSLKLIVSKILQWLKINK